MAYCHVQLLEAQLGGQTENFDMGPGHGDAGQPDSKTCGDWRLGSAGRFVISITSIFFLLHVSADGQSRIGACEPTSVLCTDPTRARCVTRDISKRESGRLAVHVAAGVGTWRRRWAAGLRRAGGDHVLASRALVRSCACRMRIEFAEWLGDAWLLGSLADKLGFFSHDLHLDSGGAGGLASTTTNTTDRDRPRCGGRLRVWPGHGQTMAAAVLWQQPTTA